MMHLAVATLLALAQTNDKTQANKYDDAWEAGWKAHCQAVLAGASSPKTTGFVLQIGDSITYSMAYGIWMRGGASRTAEDLSITSWFRVSDFPAGIDVNSKGGLYLAARDVDTSRGMTAAGGIATDEYVSGSGNGLAAMPSTTNTPTAQSYVSNTSTYGANLQITTVASAFPDAQFAVVMLGTNDCSAGRADTAFIADLQTIVAALEAQHIAVVLSTIPPHYANNALAQAYNTKIRTFAQSQGLPLIDFYAEILARQPTNWNGTLLNLNDVHPSGSGGGYDLNSDIYANGGDPATHTTGAAAANVGYLLRSWLTAQKMKEVKAYVIDNVAVPGSGSGSGGSGSGGSGSGGSGSGGSGSGSSSSGGGGGGRKCGGSIDGPVSPAMLLVAALSAVALALAARKSGF